MAPHTGQVGPLPDMSSSPTITRSKGKERLHQLDHHATPSHSDPANTTAGGGGGGGSDANLVSRIATSAATLARQTFVAGVIDARKALVDATSTSHKRAETSSTMAMTTTATMPGSHQAMGRYGGSNGSAVQPDRSLSDGPGLSALQVRAIEDTCFSPDVRVETAYEPGFRSTTDPVGLNTFASGLHPLDVPSTTTATATTTATTAAALPFVSTVGSLQSTYSPDLDPMTLDDDRVWKYAWKQFADEAIFPGSKPGYVRLASVDKFAAAFKRMNRIIFEPASEDGAAVREILDLPSPIMNIECFDGEGLKEEEEGDEMDVFWSSHLDGGASASAAAITRAEQAADTAATTSASNYSPVDANGWKTEWNDLMGQSVDQVWTDSIASRSPTSAVNKNADNQVPSSLRLIEKSASDLILSDPTTTTMTARSVEKNELVVRRLRLILGHFAHDSAPLDRLAGVDDETEQRLVRQFRCPWYSCHRRFNNIVDLELHKSAHPARLPCVHDACAVMFDDVPGWEDHIRECHHGLLRSHDDGIKVGDE